MNIPFVKDPVTGAESVTLTLTIVAFLATLVMGVLESIGKVQSTSILLELFWGTAAMYLGRRWAFKGKNVESSSNSQEKSE